MQGEGEWKEDDERIPFYSTTSEMRWPKSATQGVLVVLYNRQVHGGGTRLGLSPLAGTSAWEEVMQGEMRGGASTREGEAPGSVARP